jgi:hypothetical protein
MNTDAEIPDRFANEKFWGLRIKVVHLTVYEKRKEILSSVKIECLSPNFIVQY